MNPGPGITDNNRFLLSRSIDDLTLVVVLTAWQPTCFSDVLFSMTSIEFEYTYKAKRRGWPVQCALRPKMHRN